MMERLGLGGRERFWFLAFLVLGSIYFGLLALDQILAVLGGFSSIFIVLFMAWLLAFVLSPLIRFLGELLPFPRGVVVAITFVLVLAVLGFVAFYATSAIIGQVARLADDFPATEQRIIAALTEWQAGLQLGSARLDLVEIYRNVVARVADSGSQLLEYAQTFAGGAVAAVGSFVLVIIIALYMAIDSERILAKGKRVVPARYTDEFDIFVRSTARAFGGFLRAQIILAAIQAVLVAVIGTIFGMPYLFLIGSVSTILMLIPLFGPPLALLPPVIAALIYVPDWFIVITLVLLVTRTVIVNWIQPKLMQGALGMHPILVLVGLLVGAQVAGVWGALFGIPIIAVLNVFFNYLVNLRTLDEGTDTQVMRAIKSVEQEVGGRAPREFVVAKAAERVAEEPSRRRDSAALSAAASDVRQAADETRRAAEDNRAAAGAVRDSAGEIRDSADEVRDSAESLNRAAENLADETGDSSSH
jgi:predicted PurR-regulated permease PerM